MDQNTITVLFAAVRSAVFGTEMSEREKSLFSDDLLQEMLLMSGRHDIAHLLAYGLRKNSLVSKGEAEKMIFHAVYRYEQLNYEYVRLGSALETAGIPFIPLKGSVIREYYPEAWMRTSCDIDILVHREDLERAISYLVQTLQYVEKERATHDVSLFSPNGKHIELHFDLVEEGRANNAIGILSSVWENVSLREGYHSWFEMTDEFYYFYHIAHMAKHFENGGCGIRPFIDLRILDNMEGINQNGRDELLRKGDLLKFTEAVRKLNRVWFDGEEPDELSQRIQSYILHGGVYGSSDNKVALQQQKRGGKSGYVVSRIFIPNAKLKRYYPILEKHPWLAPAMQVRRWFMLLNPGVAKMAKNELAINHRLESSKADEMKRFLDDIGLE